MGWTEGGDRWDGQREGIDGVDRGRGLMGWTEGGDRWSGQREGIDGVGKGRG